MTQPALATPPHPELASSAVRWRAVSLGVALIVAINGFDPIARYLIDSSPLTRSHLPLALLVSVLGFAYFYNPIVRAWAPNLVLTRKDLAAIFAIGMVGGNISGYAQYMVGALTRPYYYATPENEWPTYVLPNLRPWLFPENTGDRIAWFYDGLPPGESFPWNIWAVPLFWWVSLLAALMFACVSISIILRKQWSERERLAYPLVELPMMLIQDPEPGRMLPAFFREKIFWIGFSIPAFLLLWNVTGFFVEGLPAFAFLHSNNLLTVARGFMPFYLRTDFYVICFAYFTPLNILLSVWGFHVLGMLQDGMSKRIGFGPEGYGAGVVAQNDYGLLTFVLWGLWMARGHLKDVWRKTVGPAPDVDDSGELLPYRVATIMLGASLLYIFFWLRTTGMSLPIALTFMFFTFILYLGMAKIVAQSGLVAIRGSGPTGSVKGLFGIPNMSDTDIVALNQTGILYGGAKGFVLPGSSNAGKASESTEPARYRLGGAILIGGLLSIIAFIVSSLLLGYEGPGASNFNDAYTWTGSFFNYTVTNIKNRADETWEWWWTLGFGLFGIGVTSLLVMLTQRFSWWPLHPIGFTISIQYPTRAAFFSVFLAWLFKTLILRIGGIALFNRSRLFVIGMLLGYSSSVLIGFVLDTFFFFGQGHTLHAPPL